MILGEDDFRRVENPLELLSSNFSYFHDSILNEFVDIASAYFCTIEVSKNIMLDVWDFWNQDIVRNSERGFRQTVRQTGETVQMSADHLKRAAFLTFWIRRMRPIIRNDAAVEIAPGLTTDDVRMWQNRFMGFDNEICALATGLALASIYEKASAKSDKVAVLRPVAARRHTDFRYLARELNLRFGDWDYVRDYLMVMKYKNMSPYSLYLIFKTVFKGIRFEDAKQ